MAYINNWVFCNKAPFVYLSGRLWKRNALLGKRSWERWDMGEGCGESLGGVQAGKDLLLFCQALNRGFVGNGSMRKQRSHACFHQSSSWSPGAWQPWLCLVTNLDCTTSRCSHSHVDLHFHAQKKEMGGGGGGGGEKTWNEKEKKVIEKIKLKKQNK